MRSLSFFMIVCLVFINSCSPQNSNTKASDQASLSSSDESSVQNSKSGSSPSSKYEDLESLLSGGLGSLQTSSLGDMLGGGGSVGGTGTSSASIGTLDGDVSDVIWDPRFSKPYVTAYLNPLKDKSYSSYMCPPHSFMVGQYSLYHQDPDGIVWGDRQYKMACQNLSDATGRPLERARASECIASNVNELKDNYKTEYACPEGYFLSGHYTRYTSAKTIRDHSFACCKINHPDGSAIRFVEYKVYGLEHAGVKKNCYAASDATSYLRRNFWQYECPANSLLSKISITNVPESTKTESYTTFSSKPEDAVFGYECCQAGVQKNTEDWIYSYPEEQDWENLPYVLYPNE